MTYTDPTSDPLLTPGGGFRRFGLGFFLRGRRRAPSRNPTNRIALNRRNAGRTTRNLVAGALSRAFGEAEFPTVIVTSDPIAAEMLGVEVTFDDPDIYEDMGDTFVERLRASLAYEIDRSLRGSHSLWPIRTRQSKRSFLTEDTALGGPAEITVFNDAVSRRGFPYPRVVNNARYLRSKANRNFQAVERTIKKNWAGISSRAMNAATEETVVT